MPFWARFVDSQIPIRRKRIERAMSRIEFFDAPALFVLHSPSSERHFGVVVELNPRARVGISIPHAFTDLFQRPFPKPYEGYLRQLTIRP